MALIQFSVISLLIIMLLISLSSSNPSAIQTTPDNPILLPTDRVSGGWRGVDLYCESWRFTVETNDAGSWTRIPEKCVDFVESYITGDWYRMESEAVADDAAAYAKSVKISGNGKVAWIFDIDETLLSNVPYYEVHGFGAEIFDELSFNLWVDLAEAPALPASLRLYKELEQLGFTIILLTGRDESQRNATESNLLYSGYSNWERLILRQNDDQGKPATIYKSERRKALQDEGYIIHGNSGDQWSDLTGFSVAKRSFKLPNPLYFIS
ncbi:acid phosphatase 1-like [Primulina huaijiensis]|uniref:acid phosphatase 1-like n=1 Tax=Primulina huaijiensis TaxID=1492673 RepID=UPI003CC715F9